MDDVILLVAPLVVLALVAGFGFVGCTKDFDALEVGDDESGENGQPAPQPYADAVLASGPIAYWRLSDPAGSPTAEDEIGAQPSGDHPGTYQGTVTLGQPPGLNDSDSGATPGRFDGTGQVEVAHAPVFEMSAFTVEALVHPDSIVSQGVLVGSMFTPPAGHTSSSGGWALTIVPRDPGDHPDIDGYFAAVVGDGTSLVGPPPEPLELAKLGTAWHLAVTYDGAVLTLYWDGVKRAWGSFPYAPNTQAPLQIGATFNGAIQEVAVYDKELTAAEIGTHYASNVPPDQDP